MNSFENRQRPPQARLKPALSLTLLSLLALFSAIASAGLKNTHHDFSSLSASGQICQPCHTPHGSDTSVTTAPLWNHEVTSASFTPYDSNTLNASIGQPTGTSKLCLSCHDGTVGIDSFGGRSGSVFITDPSYGGPAGGSLISWLGTDLGNDHPVSFVYDSALATADGGLHDPGTAASGLGGTIIEDMLDDGLRVECTSCHDPHIGRAQNGCGSGCHFGAETLSLWKSNARSALCLTCHTK